ncbi:MAG: hypothetical protein ABR584_12520, partial [Candidatus Baltobacteraceae bacterium]
VEARLVGDVVSLDGGDDGPLAHGPGVGDGDEKAGRLEIDKAWIEALKLLLPAPPVDRDFIETVLAKDAATLAHLFFNLHFYLVKHSGAWIHDGTL